MGTARGQCGREAAEVEYALDFETFRSNFRYMMEKIRELDKVAFLEIGAKWRDAADDAVEEAWIINIYIRMHAKTPGYCFGDGTRSI